MNSIMTIFPYKYKGLWMFDDEATGLKQEALIGGTDVILNEITKEIEGAEQGFALVFSATPFPEYQYKFDWVTGGNTGNYYKWEEKGLVGWLCPALFKYFEAAPQELYVQVKSNPVPNAQAFNEQFAELLDIAQGVTHEESLLPISWENWDEGINYGDVQFYGVEFESDWGPFKQGHKEKCVCLFMSDGVVNTYNESGEVVECIPVKLVPA